MPYVDTGASDVTCYPCCGNCDRGQRAGCVRCHDDSAQVRCLVDGVMRAADSVCPHQKGD